MQNVINKFIKLPRFMQCISFLLVREEHFLLSYPILVDVPWIFRCFRPYRDKSFSCCLHCFSTFLYPMDRFREGKDILYFKRSLRHVILDSFMHVSTIARGPVQQTCHACIYELWVGAETRDVECGVCGVCCLWEVCCVWGVYGVWGVLYVRSVLCVWGVWGMGCVVCEKCVVCGVCGVCCVWGVCFVWGVSDVWGVSGVLCELRGVGCGTVWGVRCVVCVMVYFPGSL